MKIISTSTANLSTMSALERLALYSGMDNLSVLEIEPLLSAELTPTKRATYLFEMDLQSALLEMSFNGIHIDPAERMRLTAEYEAEQERICNYLHQFCEAIGYYDYYIELARIRYGEAIGISYGDLPRSWAGWLAVDLPTRKLWKSRNEKATEAFHKSLKEFAEPFNANSPSQKLRLFYHFFGSPKNQICTETYPDCPPPWNAARGINEYRTRNQDGEYTPSADRDCLEKILKLAGDDDRDAAYWAQPFVQCCLSIADYTKALGFLRCKLENGLFKSSFGSVTETGRLNSKKNAQGFGANAQNVTPRLRSVFTSPIGYKIAAIDYAQIESRCVAARCFNLFEATNYWNAVHSGDLHSLACSMVWDNLPWPADFTLSWLDKHGPFPKDMLKAAKAIAEEEFYRGKSRRDVSKTLGHGSSYMGKPAHMSKQSHIELKLVEHYQEVFFYAFPEIKQWHLWIIEQIQRIGEITTLMGRTRQFFGRPSDDATIREAVAFDPQSMAADYVNTALLKLHKAYLSKELPITLRAQKHDELIFTYAESNETWLIPKIIRIMEHPITIQSSSGKTKQLVIPAEAETGWNLGKFDKKNPDKNPDGLMGFGTTRSSRKRNPFSVGEIIL